MDKARPFNISKREVWLAYKRVRENRGAAGVDNQTIAEFEKDLSNNLYRLWNRMSSGSYMPPPVRRVDIPKVDGRGTRSLGIPTVSDRIAQMVVKRYLEPVLEPVFHDDSFGYRPGRSAHDALAAARQRCWRFDWVLDLDIKGFLDVASYYTFSFFERVEEVWSSCRYLNSYAFCPSAIDVNGLKLAALYTLQDGLPRDAE